MCVFSLLDYLTYKLGLMYLSDLRQPEKAREEKLKDILFRKISLEDFSEKDWVDAAEYLTGQKCFCREDAYQSLQTFLKE